ncbi:MAG: UDP-3-O-(3-hydroxymyristoyl)glucosamine N-acyltransferase [Halioglobus sp.]|nr:UDP-3-O-(3-hydroxymyristoyl)glucosamine N-acyltransferase [Halioglobus sp.]
MYSLGEVADRLGLRFTGDASRMLNGLGSLATASADQLSFLASDSYLAQLAATGAGAVILSPAHAARCPCDYLETDDPYLAFARASALFAQHPTDAPGIHPGAWVADSARVAASASVGAGAVVEEDAVVGARSRIAAGAVISRGVQVGEDCVVQARAVLGAQGFGYARDGEAWVSIQSLGSLVLGNRVAVGAGTTIDRGTLDDTVIGDGVIIDNQVHIGHNCRIGANTAIAGCTGIAGSTVIGANCTLAGGVGVVGHVEICDNVHVTAMTLVTHSIHEPGSYSSGTPVTATGSWRRNAVRFKQLDAMAGRIKALEQHADKEPDKEPDTP